MLIKEVYVQNFMSFQEARLDLTNYEGITLIEGRSDSSVRSSNGSGKSAILDAITWCLFGKLLRPTNKAKADDVIHRFGKGGRTMVVVTLDVSLVPGWSSQRGTSFPSI